MKSLKLNRSYRSIGSQVSEHRHGSFVQPRKSNLMTVNTSMRVQPLDASKITHTRSLLTTKEIAGLTGFSTSFFEKGRIYGYGPKYLRIRGKILYHFDVLNQWLTDHECDPKGGGNV